MGSISRHNRCERFMDEFNSDAITYFNMSTFPNVVSCDLGISYDDCVRFYVTFANGGREETLAFDTIVFDPEWNDDLLVEEVRFKFKLSEKGAMLRLKKAQLI